MDSGLKGMRALITGGPTGIGFGIAEGLAREGTNLVLASRRPGDEAVRRLRLLGVGCEWVQADVSSEDGVIRMVDEAWHVFDGIELYVNNAAGTWHEAITKLTSDSWEKTQTTNVSACAYACREVGRRFIGQGHGSVLIIGSTAAHVPLYRESSYRVSKAGLKALMEVLAIELIPFGIRVNLLTPRRVHNRAYEGSVAASDGRLAHPTSSYGRSARTCGRRSVAPIRSTQLLYRGRGTGS